MFMKEWFVKRMFCLLSFLLFVFINKMNAQHSTPDTLVAFHLVSQINLDGNPNEAAWQSVRHISNFTQRELNFGEPGSEKTETAILYDNTSLYIGVWCYQNETNKISAKFLQRDFD